MLKTIAIALLATLLGGAVGISLAYRELAHVGSVGLGSPVASLQVGSSMAADAASGRLPRAVLPDGTTHNFGTMERGATLSHTFTIVNEGTAPLTLEKGETTCKCTLSDLSHGELAPGESTPVQLEWTPKEYETAFSQSAEILTNDPAQPVISFTVTGRVIQSVRPAPDSLALGAVPMNEPTTAELLLFGYPDQQLEVEQITWATETLAEYFSAEVLPIPPKALASDPDAKTGKLVKIIIKPGLPLGPVSQKMRISTNLPELPVIEVPLVMTVTGDLSLVGRGYDADTSTLMLGRVRSDEGEAVKLNLLVKGPYRNDIQVTLGEVTPSDVLQVTLGEKVPLKEGALYRIPVEIAIEPGARKANYLGAAPSEQGLVVLETTHPSVKQFPIRVRFAVE